MKIMACGWSHHFMANRWEKVERVTDFIFLGSKIPEDSHCNHEIKGRLLLGRKPMTNLDILLKSMEIILPTGVSIVKAMFFPGVIYRCDNWTIKTDHWRTDAFKSLCWRTLLIFPWTARRSNQSILKEINQEYSLEGLMLKLQYFGHLIWRAYSLEKTLMLGKIRTRGEDDRGWDGWLALLSQWTWVWANSGR